MFVNEVPNHADISALIISELRDGYGIKYRKDKKLKSSQSSGQHRIFNVPLKELEFTDVILSSGHICQVPMFVVDACQHVMRNVEVEGLFRKAGSAARQKEIRDNLESGMPFDDLHNVIDVANILKYFFRELPEPMLPPGNFQESILRCLLFKGSNERKIDAIKMMCLLLPVLNLSTLVYFMQFLNSVSRRSDFNKMSIKNLAILFAPNLMPIRENIGQRLISHVQIIEILIENADAIGVVPTAIAAKVQSSIPMETYRMHDGGANGVDSNVDPKKKKKRRSGSLTRMFNGLRKIVGAIGGSSENLEEAEDMDFEPPSTPCLTKSTKKRKVLEANAFSNKKKKEVVSLLPNGGIFPSTPICTKQTKKSRLSLGGKRYVKKAQPQPTVEPMQEEVPSTSNLQVPPLERRWSVVGASWNRKKDKSKTESSRKSVDSILNEARASSSQQDCPVNAVESQTNSVRDAQVAQAVTTEDDDFVKISKSEYEEIKERVFAIETRISKEFTKIRTSIGNNSFDSLDEMDTAHLNGPDKVRDKYERALEETVLINSSPSTDQLAKRLSRDLKIRRSAEHKVIRSPSARKIGNIRRRSQENVRLTRNKSWHIGTNAVQNFKRPAAVLQSPATTIATPMIESPEASISCLKQANIKRGRPNTVHSGLRPIHASPIKVKPFNLNEDSENVPTHKYAKEDLEQQLAIKKSTETQMQNEKWVCSNIFFGEGLPMENSPIGLRKSSRRKSNGMEEPKTPPGEKMMDQKSEPQTPRIVNHYPAMEALKTPMLPPRVPTSMKKTPFNPSRTPQRTISTFGGKTHLTPLLQQEQSGRASIARLRSQNAGMVMAKAKLFDELGTDVPEAKCTKPARRECSRAATVQQPQSTANLDPMERVSMARKVSSPRRNVAFPNKGSPTNISRRQNQRYGKYTPLKKSPLAATPSTLSISDNTKINRQATLFNETLMHGSPNTAFVESTPHIKRALTAKSPRRIARTPQKKRKAASPLRAITPFKARNSPRLNPNK